MNTADTINTDNQAFVKSIIPRDKLTFEKKVEREKYKAYVNEMIEKDKLNKTDVSIQKPLEKPKKSSFNENDVNSCLKNSEYMYSTNDKVCNMNGSFTTASTPPIKT